MLNCKAMMIAEESQPCDDMLLPADADCGTLAASG